MTKQTKTIEDYPDLNNWCIANYRRPNNFSNTTVVFRGTDVEEKLLEMQSKIDELEEQNHRKDVFIKGHVEKWEGVDFIDPSIRVLKRALSRVDESMGVPERLLNKESK